MVVVVVVVVAVAAVAVAVAVVRGGDGGGYGVVVWWSGVWSGVCGGWSAESGGGDGRALSLIHIGVIPG